MQRAKRAARSNVTAKELKKVKLKRRKQRRKVGRVIQIKKLRQRKMDIKKKSTRTNKRSQLANRRVRVEK